MADKDKDLKRSVLESETEAIADWSEQWNRTQAMAMLCIPPRAYRESQNNLRTRALTVLDAAFQGQTARLREDEDLAKNAPPLVEVVEKVRRQMEQLELPTDWPMYPVLWIRLLREAGAAMELGVYRRLGEWRLRRETEGAVVFALAKPSTKGSQRAALRFPGTKTAEVQGWTVEELLLRQVAPPSRWPFHRTWVLRVVARTDGVEAAASAPAKSVQSAAAPVRKKSRRKRKTLEDFQALCGSGVMKQLAKALRQEAKSGRENVTAIGDGFFRTELSATELLRKLRRFQGDVLTGADSTLRKAFAAYMTLPRGRPPRSEPEPVVRDAKRKTR